MKKPWDNEPTPLTDAENTVVISTNGQVRVLSALKEHASELERRMRHAERLLEGGLMNIQFGTFPEFDAKVRAHLTAANEEAK
jgi:hypothetical protein